MKRKLYSKETWVKRKLKSKENFNEKKILNAVGSGGIVLQAPTLTDSRVAIDAKISAIGSTLKTIWIGSISKVNALTRKISGKGQDNLNIWHALHIYYKTQSNNPKVGACFDCCALWNWEWKTRHWAWQRWNRTTDL